jgi:aryl-alcohol dehydrogenase-like predicted oxidoreductase
MTIRQLGTNGPSVLAIGLGCMRMTPMGHGFAHQGTDADGIATIQAMLDRGVTLLDTGDFYSMGANEMLVGKAIRHRRDRAFLSVKTGALRSPSGAFLGVDLRPNSLKNFCTYSLQRLGVDYIDLYQPSRADPNVPIEDTVGAIADLIKDGKVRYLGVSEHNADQLRRAHAVHPVAAIEIEFSLACRFIEREILPTARELGVGIVPYSVVTQGLLTSEFPAELLPNDSRRIFPRFQGENLAKNIAAARQLGGLAKRKGVTVAQLAIAWVLAQYEMMVPIIGMGKPSRVEENVAAASLELTAADLSELNAAFVPGAVAGNRYPGPLNDLVPS